MNFDSQIVHRVKKKHFSNRAERIIVAVMAVVAFMLVYLFRLFSQGYFHFDLVNFEYVEVTDVKSGVVPIGEITQGCVIEQELPRIGSPIEGISVSVATYARNNTGNVLFQIKGENDVVYGEKQIAAEQILDNSYVSVPLLEPQAYTQDGDLKLVITSTSEGGKAITLYKTENDGIADCALTVDGREQAGDVVVRFVNKEYTQLFKSIIVFTGCLLALLIYYILQRKFGHNVLTGILSFVLLFAIYVLRTPEDFFSSYLWAEDGTVLISESIRNGFGSIFTPTNGTLWVIQKLMAYVCYRFVSLFNGMKWLPILQGVAARLVAVGGIFYFISDKFNWIIQDRIKRFFICFAIVLLLPMQASDVFTCDTSLPFVLNITVFYIGLNLLCREEPSNISALEAIFLALLAVSSAAAPFAAAVAGLSTLRWFIYHVRKKDLRPKTAIIECIKLGFICCMVLLQLRIIMKGGRANTEIDLPGRIWVCIQAFVVLPYWQNFNVWGLIALSVIGWAGLIYLSKLSWRIVLYSALFSFGFLLYSSMVATVQDAYSILNGGCRYTLVSYAVSAMLSGIVLCKLWERKKLLRPVFCLVVSTLLFISLETYHVSTVGTQYIEPYDSNITLFEKNGKDLVSIPIGPWKPWTMAVPANIVDGIVDDNIQISVDIIDGQLASEGISISAEKGTVDISGWVSTKDGQPFTHLLLKESDGVYKAPLSIDMRPDVANYFNNDDLLYSGYTISASTSCFTEGTTNLEFVGRTPDGVYHIGSAQIQTLFAK